MVVPPDAGARAGIRCVIWKATKANAMPLLEKPCPPSVEPSVTSSETEDAACLGVRHNIIDAFTYVANVESCPKWH